MHGNVWEWCTDDNHNYVGAPTEGSAWVNSKENFLTKNYTRLRGGSWAYSPTYCRSAIRDYSNRREALNNRTGFRVVCDGGRTL